MERAARLLAAGGPLARHIPGFTPRIEQQEMADAIADAIANGSMLIAEAGTGTGKTLAYLVPALLSGAKVTIATGTKNLQDQLFYRDLPQVRAALALSSPIALLKGRANYLCLHRLQQHIEQGASHDSEQGVQLHAIHAWAKQTHSGDIGEMTQISEQARIWSHVTASADDCTDQQCAQFEHCFLMRARQQAEQAQIVIINHHLLLADMALRDEGYNALLAATDAFIIDEAHQLPEIAARFFGRSLASRQLQRLTEDSRSAQQQDAPDQRQLSEHADMLGAAVSAMVAALRDVEHRAERTEGLSVAWSDAAHCAHFRHRVEQLSSALQQLQQSLASAALRSKNLEQCARRCDEQRHHFEQLTRDDVADAIPWLSSGQHAFTLHHTPLEVCSAFQERLAHYDSSWIFTSATLAVGEKFKHFAAQLGLEQAVTRQWLSPFDYAQQSCCYIPAGMPDPRHDSYTAAVVEAALPVLRASRGRAFMLFTSHRALQQAARLLHHSALDYPLLVQGSAPRSELVARFRRHGNAILLGSSSFWQGVDVPGPALSCVIIDKLPFASPGNPVLQARIEALKSAGRNPFFDYQLPQAVIALKQGIGRLIRGHNDRGLLMICDPRLLGKSYGKAFLKSMPAMPRSHSLEAVHAFFSQELTTTDNNSGDSATNQEV
ncbi:MAG: ATP-dependent DNA helicase [Gammaproteobacteria bacterium]|nr:ATP-dependent DNA helicase [Gammaproteobacteria bacterium]